MIQAETLIAVPLVLLFVIGFSVTASFSVMNVLIVDLYYSTPATATAANNLVRCLLGAASTAVIHPMLNGLGRGWTYSCVAAIFVLVSPLSLATYSWGPTWRKRREAREAREARKMGLH